MTTPAVSRPPAPSSARTPLMRQYLEVKREHPDAFVFFRLGDFYEMFFEDAVRGAGLLGLTLTSRNKSDAQPIPMCGVPWHQRDTYVSKLLRRGYKVAICDQLEDPALAKGLVSRGVTEVLTPGSVMAEGFVEARANRFLAALWPTEERLGVCLVDASTAEVKLAELEWPEARAMLSRLPIAEWLLPAAEDLAPALSARLERVAGSLEGARTPLPAERFADRARVAERWGDPEVLAALPAAAGASAAALGYLDRVQGTRALPRPRIERWSEGETLRYDAATARHLEIFTPQP